MVEIGIGKYSGKFSGITPDPTYICAILRESKHIKQCEHFYREYEEEGLWIKDKRLIIDFQIARIDKRQRVYEIHSSFVITSYNEIHMMLRFPLLKKLRIDVKKLAENYNLNIKPRMLPEDESGGIPHLVGDMKFKKSKHVYQIAQRLKKFIDDYMKKAR